MRNWYQKLTAGAVVAAALCAAAGTSAIASKPPASVVRGEYDFSDMTVRRVWFNADDPVFLIDDYDRVWADQNVNAVGCGDASQADSAGNLMAPMEEMFRQIGGSYAEDGNRIVIGLNGDTLELTVGSRDVAFNGVKMENALTEEQIPARVNQKDNDYNTFLTGDYYVTYLPAAYVLHTFQADVYYDSNVGSLYAAIPIFHSDLVPSLDTVAEGYGIRYDDILDGTAEYSYGAASNIMAIQNEDGGFALLPDNTDMEQRDLAGRRGTLTGASTLEKGATTAMLDYLADAVSSGEPFLTDALIRGVEYLVNSQSALGGWQMSPSEPEGFRGNLVYTDHITTDVLRLLRRVNTESGLKDVAEAVGTEKLTAAIQAGDQFILNSQLVYDGRKTGWASQYKLDGTPTMGRTYERESVSAIETAEIADYLMEFYGSDNVAVKAAVDGAAAWLQEVKIADQEAVEIVDYSMQNGCDIFLLGKDEPGVKDTSYADDGLGTWAANYQYVDGKFVPLYADVDPERPNQKYVNQWNASSSDDLIWYATRTTVTYYDNDLADGLLAEYAGWAAGNQNVGN